MAKVDDWAKMTSDELYETLESVNANEQAVYQSHGTSASAFDGTKANLAQHNTKKSKDKSKEQKNALTGVCFNFQKGSCTHRDKCRFRHENTPEQKQVKSHSAPAPAPAAAPAATVSETCDRCGGQHSPKTCNYAKLCELCKRGKHMESLCKRSKSKANFGVVDGSATLL